MYRLWDSLIEPLLRMIDPSHIVEIGAHHGRNTENLLAYVRDHGGFLSTIDPKPKFSSDDFKRVYGDLFALYKVRSLEMLRRINSMDVVLIDGDHNWYTVFNELKLIEASTINSIERSPVVLLHDTGWPYGRRDLYYDPEAIPAEYRHPYERKGMMPGNSALHDQDGFNRDYFNAAHENGARNGVLTAIEDFMEEGSADYEFVNIPANFGIGVLSPSTVVESNSELRKWYDSMCAANGLMPVLQSIEENRIARALQASKIRRRLNEQTEVLKQYRRLRGMLRRRQQEVAKQASLARPPICSLSARLAEFLLGRRSSILRLKAIEDEVKNCCAIIDQMEANQQKENPEAAK